MSTPAAPQPWSTSAMPMKSILVVDDVPEILDMFRGLMRRVRNVDVRLTTELNSQRALELVSQERFDLVLTDFRMRQVDGIEVLVAAKRAHPDGRRILMTGYNEVPTSMDRVVEAQVDAYIQKPLKSQDLLLLLIAVLQGNREALAQSRRSARELEESAVREQRALGLA